MILKPWFLLLFISIFTFQVYGQFEDDNYWLKDRENDSINEGITEYDKYNPFMEGDSIRLCGKVPCNGWIKDFYSDNITIKHQGSYVNGKLTSVYKNNYPNGTLERFFQLSANGTSANLETYYPNAQKHYKVVYRKQSIIEYEEYDDKGNPQIQEKMDKKGQYYEYQRYFYPDGKPFSHLTILEKGKKIYTYLSWYDTGEKRQEGFKICQLATGDYLKHGIWKYYSKDGKLLKSETYSNGRLIED